MARSSSIVVSPPASPARSRRSALAAGAALALLTLGACGKPLFSEKDERSQFDRYDRVRNKFAPQYVYDEFGREQPNLRGRLAPKR